MLITRNLSTQQSVFAQNFTFNESFLFSEEDIAWTSEKGGEGLDLVNPEIAIQSESSKKQVNENDKQFGQVETSDDEEDLSFVAKSKKTKHELEVNEAYAEEQIDPVPEKSKVSEGTFLPVPRDLWVDF